MYVCISLRCTVHTLMYVCISLRCTVHTLMYVCISLRCTVHTLMYVCISLRCTVHTLMYDDDEVLARIPCTCIHPWAYLYSAAGACWASWGCICLPQEILEAVNRQSLRNTYMHTYTDRGNVLETVNMQSLRNTCTCLYAHTYVCMYVCMFVSILLQCKYKCFW